MIMAIVLLTLTVLVVAAAFADLSGRWADTAKLGRDLWKDDR